MIKKFHAATTRDALRQVRDALGADAIILSNRQVEGGIEIIAVADLDISALAGQAQPQAASQPQPQPVKRRSPPVEYTAPPPRQPAYTPPPQPPARPAYTPPPPPPEPDVTTFTDYIAQREASVIRPAPTRRPQPRPAPQPDWHTPEPAYAAAPPHPSLQAKTSPPPVQVQGAEATAPMLKELTREMRQLRTLMEGQLAGLAWNDTCRREPHRAELIKELLAAGFSPALSKQILDRMPPEVDFERARKWIRAAIVRNLKVAENADDLIDRGGIYALVGPTGVGKTTTVAKLAARAVLRHGADKVAMITTDSYRIGAQDQLRIYGRILGTPVFATRDENDLELTLVDLRHKHLVFIDMSQKDRRVDEQTQMLSGQNARVKRLLLLGAPSQGITLEEVVRAYGGPGLAGCILTKIDEAQVYGTVLDVALRHQILVHYVTNGQRVPEDLHLANARYLIDRAFRLATQPGSAFHPEDDDYPLLMAAAERRDAQADDTLTDLGAYGATA